MLDVLFWSLFSTMLLTVIPDRWRVRREIAKRQRLSFRSDIRLERD